MNLDKKWFNHENGLYYDSLIVQKYKDDNKHKVDIAIVYSGRGRRKSFDISARLIERCWRENKTIGYVRRYDKELSTVAIESYFSDKTYCVDEKGKKVGNFVEELTEGVCNAITVYQKKIYFSYVSLDEDKGVYVTKRIQQLGHCFSMSLAEQYKSLQFPTCIALIFEEFLTNETYITNEGNKLLNLISTVGRGREDFICYMVANTISRINPYADDFGIRFNQQAGTQNFYKLYKGIKKGDSEDYYLISVEYLRNKDDEITESKKGGILSKRKKKYITNTNNWEELNTYPTLSLNVDVFDDFKDSLYSCVFENKAFKFLGQVKMLPTNIFEMLENDGMPASDEMIPILYVSRKTSKIKVGTRTFSDKPIISTVNTVGFRMCYKSDYKIKDLIERGWVIYADNLTGNEFHQCLKDLIAINGFNV